MDDSDYAVPISVRNEQFVLGAILIESGVQFGALSLTPGDFGLEKHRRLLAVMESLDKRGVPIDRATVTDDMHRSGQLDSIGGFAYICSLDEGMPLIVDLDAWIQILRDYKIRRQLIESAEAIRAMAIAGIERGSRAIERAIELVTDIATASESDRFPSLAQIIQKHGGINGWLAERAALGMPTGYSILDEKTGGIMPTELWVLAGPTGGGKSTFARNLACQLAAAGFPGAITSLEMGEVEVTDGFIAMDSGLSINGLKRGFVNDRYTFRDAMLRINDLPIRVDPQASTLPDLRACLLRLKKKFGCRWAIVDFLQQMQSVGRQGNREQEVASFAYGLKRLAIELDMAIIALSQLSRDHQKNNRKPELTDLRESGSIEFSANFVGFICSEFQETQMEEYPAELLVRKQRAGEKDFEICYGWKKHCGKFIERGLA